MTVSCGYCGKEFVCKRSRFMRAKHGVLFCSTTCFGRGLVNRIIRNREFQNAEPTTAEESRRRARSMYRHRRRPCDVCGCEHTQFHHRDGNPFNNDYDNIACLCPKHHYHADRHGLLESVGYLGGITRAKNGIRDSLGRFVA